MEWVGEPSFSIQLYNYQANNVSVAIIGSQSPISFKKGKKWTPVNKNWLIGDAAVGSKKRPFSGLSSET